MRTRNAILALAGEVAVIALLAYAALFGTGVQPAEAGSVNGSTAWNYCQWFNPNPAGYVISSVDYLNYNGGSNSTIQCRIAPTVTPSYGPMCMQITIAWFYDPPGIHTYGWYPAPSWACPPI
jgi:hypothetical protein